MPAYEVDIEGRRIITTDEAIKCAKLLGAMDFVALAGGFDDCYGSIARAIAWASTLGKLDDSEEGSTQTNDRKCIIG